MQGDEFTTGAALLHCPSWSWASVPGRVCHHWSYEILRLTFYPELVSWNINVDDQQAYITGSITVRGNLRRYDELGEITDKVFHPFCQWTRWFKDLHSDTTLDEVWFLLLAHQPPASSRLESFFPARVILMTLVPTDLEKAEFRRVGLAVSTDLESFTTQAPMETIKLV